MKLMQTRRLIFFGLGALVIILYSSSCSKKLSVEDYVAKELERKIRIDSLVYGVHFGMTFKEFDAYCLEMNKKKIFKQNPNGSAVRLEVNNNFGDVVYFDFFPEVSPNGRLSKLKCVMSYSDFSYYNQKFAMENLVEEAIVYFENGYKGNNFFKIPHENKLLKYKYIKIDGNRKIVLSPTFEGQKITVDFEDTSVANE